MERLRGSVVPLVEDKDQSGIGSEFGVQATKPGYLFDLEMTLFPGMIEGGEECADLIITLRSEGNESKSTPKSLPSIPARLNRLDAESRKSPVIRSMKPTSSSEAGKKLC